MVNWKKIRKMIPIRVQLSPKVYYEIVWVDDFVDGETLGEMVTEIKQIRIKTNQSPKMTVVTYLHEFLHAVCNEYNVNLTETQILALEKAFYYVLKPNNLFDKK